MITKFINEIRLETYFSHTTYKDEDRWSFIGDGWGDYEEISSSADKHIVELYCEHCKKQIELAEQYLMEI